MMVGLLTTVFTLLLSWSVFSDAAIPSAYRHIAELTEVPAATLYAVALAESQYRYSRLENTVYEPWPWSLNVNGRGFRFNSREDAYQALCKAIERGDSVDVGIMQINWRWHRQRFNSPWSMLDPHINLQVGAEILREQYDRAKDWWVAVGAYHAPGRDHASIRRANHYRERVKKQWVRISEVPQH